MKRKQPERLYPQRTKNFVAPIPEVRKVKHVDVLQEKMPSSLYAPVELRSVATSERDRAIGFTISTAGLAVIVATGSTALIVAGWGIPFLSSTTLIVFLCVCALIWAGAWFFHAFSSEGGIGLVSVLLQYRLLRHEQQARLQHIERLMEEDDEN